MQTFEKNIINSYGHRGKVWLSEIPQILIKLSKKYQITHLKPVFNMSHNYVTSGYRDGKPIILKLGLNFKALSKEASCLKAFKNFGAVDVLVNEEGMLILERAVPGGTLKEYFLHREDESIEITSSLIKNLHTASIPVDHHFFHVKDLLQTLDNELSISKKILIKARTLRGELIATSHKTVLLHGDLHHDNILKNGDGWVVIDPKGFIGDPVYEVAAFIRNPIPDLLNHDMALDIIRHRINRFSKILEYPSLRIINWCFVQSVLCWAWALEDKHEHDAYFEELTNLFEKIMYV